MLSMYIYTRTLHYIEYNFMFHYRRIGTEVKFKIDRTVNGFIIILRLSIHSKSYYCRVIKLLLNCSRKTFLI